MPSSGPQDLLPFPPHDGRHHTPARIHTFRSCSSSSIFGAACALTFSWGSSDSASLSEGPSAASMLTAAEEKQEVSLFVTVLPVLLIPHWGAKARGLFPMKKG